VFSFFALLFNQGLIYGSIELSRGVNTGSDALSFLEDTFTSLDTYSEALTSEGNTLNEYFLAANSSGRGCSTSPLSAQLSEQYFPYVSDFGNAVSPIPGQCSSASDQLDYYGVGMKNIAVWSLYSVLTVGFLIYCLGLWTQHKLVLKASLAVSQMLMLIFFVICPIELVALVNEPPLLLLLSLSYAIL
jgi:hypothetical protein